ncbi:MAG: 4Fe-4S binding protein [Bacteroidales bacterium]|nr:4Fe-4S binding protein [Bacteroidales bacterium]MDE5608880.1 4Fe-4S binding protein [Bacteroidales bacterium]MDE6694701.1 4Fe-4S binding protein [Bacteroidales bacterium]
MAKFQGALVVDKEKCKGCGICVSICPTKAIGLSKEVNGKGYNFAMLTNEDACVGCASCGHICPDGVITVYRAQVN